MVYRVIQLAWSILAWVRAISVQKLIVFVLCILSAIPTSAQVLFHYEDRFSNAERLKLQQWVMATTDAMSALVGEPGFSIHIYLHRYEEGNGPVPWAHTERGRKQGVHYYVNPRYSSAELSADWTSAHELSHLILPYLGTKNSWFAEGFASFMQYQVMLQEGALDAATAQRRYRVRFERARRVYEGHRDFAKLPFALAGPKLRAQRKYPTMYWGGALYFAQVDEQLRTKHNSSLIEVLNQYLACCRKRQSSLTDLVRRLDQVAGSTVFSQTLESFRQKSGFPRIVSVSLAPTLLLPNPGIE